MNCTKIWALQGNNSTIPESKIMTRFLFALLCLLGFLPIGHSALGECANDKQCQDEERDLDVNGKGKCSLNEAYLCVEQTGYCICLRCPYGLRCSGNNCDCNDVCPDSNELNSLTKLSPVKQCVKNSDCKGPDDPKCPPGKKPWCQNKQCVCVQPDYCEQTSQCTNPCNSAGAVRYCLREKYNSGPGRCVCKGGPACYYNGECYNQQCTIGSRCCIKCGPGHYGRNQGRCKCSGSLITGCDNGIGGISSQTQTFSC